MAQCGWGSLGRVGAVVRQRSSCGGTSWGSDAKGDLDEPRGRTGAALSPGWVRVM